MIDTGLYRHYKGGLYRVLHVAVHTETGVDMVVYEDYYDDSKVWVRPLGMFYDVIDVVDNVKRFDYIGKELLNF